MRRFFEMKFLKYFLLTLLVIVVLAVLGVWLFLEPLVKTSVNKFGSQIVGTNVSLDGFKFSPFAGEVELKGLKVANPEGYKTENLLSLGRILVKVDVKSLMSDVIVVDDISVNEPKISYEMPDFTTSNVMQIQQNVAKNTAPSADKAEAQEAETVKEETATAPSKKVVIKRVLVEGGALSALTPLQTNASALELNLPAVEITGIGESNNGENIKDTIVTIFNKILFNATSVVTKALGNISEMSQKAADKAVATAKDKVADEANSLLNKVKFW